MLSNRMKSPEPRLKVIAPKIDEIIYTNREILSTAYILIFKKVPNYKPKVNTEKPNEIRNPIEMNFVYTENVLAVTKGIGRVFEPFIRISPESFSSAPYVPTSISKKIIIKTDEDWANVIRMGYDVIAYLDLRQMRKELAYHFIEYKKAYGYEDMHSDVLYKTITEQDQIPSVPSAIAELDAEMIDNIMAVSEEEAKSMDDITPDGTFVIGPTKSKAIFDPDNKGG